MAKAKKKTTLPDATEPPSPFSWQTISRDAVPAGLGLFLLLRPWRDGITFPSFNVYFTAGATLLLFIFLLQSIRTRHPLHSKVPLALLSAFTLVCALTLFTSVHFDLSLRALLHQLSYLFLFYLATQALQTRRAIGIVLGALLLGAFLNTLWAVIHATYVLPYVRESIANNPSMLQYYFQTSVLTPELKHRLEMGRAFGTFLFPNALGGYIALCLPIALSELLASGPKFKAVLGQAAFTHKIAIPKLVAVALASAVLMGLYVFCVNRYLLFHTNEQISMIRGALPSLYYYAIFPLIIGLFSAYLYRLKGFLGYITILKTLVLLLLTLLLSYGLWITFSRGAWVGVFLAILLSAFLLFSSSPRSTITNPIARQWMKVALLLLVCGLWSIPALDTSALEDDGFVTPNPSLDWGIQNQTHEVGDLSVSGESVVAEDVISTNSLAYRITYWQVALRMARAHLLTGVGLGNFGTLYGQYQFLDAYDVKMAHNDYLQTLVETGLFGLLFFLAFWVYFVVWGGARILSETVLDRRILLCGLYAGALAFLIQALVDFNFMNPSLASIAYLVAGVFYARAKNLDAITDTKSSPRIPWLSGFIVLLVCITAWGTARQFTYDFGRSSGDLKARLLHIGDERRARLKIELTKFLLSPAVKTYTLESLNPQGQALAPPSQRVEALRELIQQDEDLLRLGPIRIPLDDGTGTTRQLQSGEVIPNTAYVFVIHPDQAEQVATKYSNQFLNSLEALDARYPYGTYICDLSADYFYVLGRGVGDSTQQLLYSEQLLRWSQKRAQRNPHDPAALVDLSRAYWERGRLDTTQKQLDYYRKGIDAYRQAVQRYPTAHDLQQNFGQAMTHMGNAFTKAGLNDEGKSYLLEGEEAYNRARLLARYKHDILNLR